MCPGLSRSMQSVCFAKSMLGRVPFSSFLFSLLGWPEFRSGQAAGNCCTADKSVLEQLGVVERFEKGLSLELRVSVPYCGIVPLMQADLDTSLFSELILDCRALPGISVPSLLNPCASTLLPENQNMILPCSSAASGCRVLPAAKGCGGVFSPFPQWLITVTPGSCAVLGSRSCPFCSDAASHWQAPSSCWLLHAVT